MHWLDVLAQGYLCLPLLGFFGTQAVRLLRESWDGVIRARRDGEIRPYGATNLANELYAMLDDNIPQTNNAPVTVNNPPHGDGVTINSSPGDNAFTVNGGNVNFGGVDAPSTLNFGRGPTATYGGDVINLGGRTITLGNIGAGNVGGGNIGAGNVAPGNIPDININGNLLVNGKPSGGGTTVFLGRVVGGSGDTYTVSLYGDGPGSPPTDTVTAVVPQIADDEAIPAGTWIAAVHEVAGGHAFQPPIWLA